MLFGNEPKPESQGGRWSTPASLSALGEKLQDHMIARSSVGSKYIQFIFVFKSFF